MDSPAVPSDGAVGAGVDEAVEGELRLLRPEVRREPDAIAALLDDDFVEIGASGRTWTRAEMIADLATAPALDVEVRDLTARQVHAGVVLVSYTTVSGVRRVRRSSWWRETGGVWRCFFHQGTVVPPDA